MRSFLRWIFSSITSSQSVGNAPPDLIDSPGGDDVDRLDERSAIPNAVSDLVEEGCKYYPHTDTQKALSCFRKAIDLMGPAPQDKSAQEELDIGDVGFAFWASFICLDILNSPQSELEQLLSEADAKSPVSARRIRERLEEIEKNSKASEEIEELVSVVTEPVGETSKEQMEALKKLVNLCTDSGAWWVLRDTAISIREARRFNEAWSLLNSALFVAMNRGGNLASIYCAMGDTVKAEGRHFDAARQYLLSCIYSGGRPTRHALDQLRISLKKVGLPSDRAEQVRDKLVSAIGTEDAQALLAKLDSEIKEVHHGSSEKTK